MTTKKVLLIIGGVVAVLAVLGALSGIVPATAPAASSSVCAGGEVLFLRLC